MAIFNKRTFSKYCLAIGLIISGNALGANSALALNSNSQQASISSQLDVVSARLNVNQATLQQLMSVKGLGQKKAQAILDYIEKHGKLVSLDELVEVKGIGNKLIDKVKGQLTI